VLSLPAAAAALAALPTAAWLPLRYLQTPFPVASAVLNALLALLGEGGGQAGAAANAYASAGAALPSWQRILRLLSDPTLPAQCLALTAQAAHLAEMLAEEQSADGARQGEMMPAALRMAIAPAVASAALGNVEASVAAAAGGSASASIPIPSAAAFGGLALSFGSVQAARRVLAQRPDARAECAALSLSVWPRAGTLLASVEGGAAPLFVIESLPALQALLEWELALVVAVEEALPWDAQLAQPPEVCGVLPGT
jgi:hypothetical protein